MRSISIRNIPDEVYSVLQSMARQNRRSLQEQVRYLLEQEAMLVRDASSSKSREWRKKLQGRQFSNVPELIRKDRER